MAHFKIIRTSAFNALAAEYAREHSNIEDDLAWLIGRLAQAPESIGDRMQELGKLALPIFKTRCKDSCHKIGASGAWRIYYAIKKNAKEVYLLFLHHKKEYENPSAKFLLQKLERAFDAAPKRE